MNASYAILLGASKFPRYAEFRENAAFLESSNDFRKYLLDHSGLGLGADRVLNLFDSPSSPGDQLYEINAFLRRAGADPAAGSANLIVYYVGHGLLAGRNQDYYLAIGSLNDSLETSTALRYADLADVLKQGAYDFRRYLFLDACFSERSVRESMGAVESLIHAKAVAPLEEDGDAETPGVPMRGTAMLCSADKDSVARSPLGMRRTTFSDALLTVLEQGDSSRGRASLSLQEVFEITRSRLKRDPKAPLPVIHSPDQRDGDIASVRLFPNNAYRPEERAERTPSVAFEAEAVQERTMPGRAAAVAARPVPPAPPPVRRPASPKPRSKPVPPARDAAHPVPPRIDEVVAPAPPSVAPGAAATPASPKASAGKKTGGDPKAASIFFGFLCLTFPVTLFFVFTMYGLPMGLVPTLIASVVIFFVLAVQAFFCVRRFKTNGVVFVFPGLCSVEFLAFAFLASASSWGMNFLLAAVFGVYAFLFMAPASVMFRLLDD